MMSPQSCDTWFASEACRRFVNPPKKYDEGPISLQQAPGRTGELEKLKQPVVIILLYQCNTNVIFKAQHNCELRCNMNLRPCVTYCSGDQNYYWEITFNGLTVDWSCDSFLVVRAERCCLERAKVVSMACSIASVLIKTVLHSSSHRLGEKWQVRPLTVSILAQFNCVLITTSKHWCHVNLPSSNHFSHHGQQQQQQLQQPQHLHVIVINQFINLSLHSFIHSIDRSPPPIHVLAIQSSKLEKNTKFST